MLSADRLLIAVKLPKLPAANLLVAKLQANKQQRAESRRGGVIQSFKHLVGSLKLGSLELGGQKPWPL
jgi:hypothetical protein